MCRHAAYLGPPRPIGALLRDSPHSLCEQGRAPKEMVVAKDNPDGWGVAWWPESATAPERYRTTTRMWDDTRFRAGDELATAVLGAVRKASPNTTLRTVNNAPFVAETRAGPMAFSLNGHAFHGSCEARVRDALTPAIALEGDTDSEALFALTRDRIDAGMDPAAALGAVHHVVDPGPDVYVNLLLVSSTRIVATTWRHTLYLRHDDTSTTVASEALDTTGSWQRVPDASLLDATATGVILTPLKGLR